jgi:NodT family efflux transporter outer membrane factor (OMF) lipoprotein
VDYQRFEFEAARLTLAGNVATAAIREAGLRAQIADTEAIVQAQQRQLDIAEQRLRAGGVAKVDVQRQRGELAQSQALLPGLLQQLAATRHQLAVYLGQPPASARLPEFRLADLTLPDTLPLSLPSTMAQRRPDIRAAEALLHQASANIGVATAQLYPQLTLSGSAGSQSLSARDLFGSLNVWSLGAGLVQPVFRGGELVARKRAAQAAYEQALAAYQQAVLQGLREVADALRALEADANTLQARADSARQAADTLAIVSGQYRIGGVSQLAVLDAQRQYRQAALSLAQATASRFTDSAALLQALGGGWWQEPESAAR